MVTVSGNSYLIAAAANILIISEQKVKIILFKSINLQRVNPDISTCTYLLLYTYLLYIYLLCMYIFIEYAIKSDAKYQKQTEKWIGWLSLVISHPPIFCYHGNKTLQAVIKSLQVPFTKFQPFLVVASWPAIAQLVERRTVVVIWLSLGHRFKSGSRDLFINWFFKIRF